jgi:Flp pilus assembly protein TadB
MTDTLIAMALAAGCGFGLFLLLHGTRRRPQQLSDAVGTLEGGRKMPVTSLVRRPDADLSGFQRYLSRPGLRLLEAFGLADNGVLEDQLRVLDKTMQRHAYEKMFGGLVGLLLPLFFGVALSASGNPISPLLLLVASVILSALGFFYPDLPLTELVKKRQQAFRHSLSSYLDLVSIILAGGGGTESALAGAAEAGEGWVFAEIRSALRRGELTGRSPWDMFEELGTHYGIEELRELASSVALAGGHGARVRQSLEAKAEALRSQQTSEIEALAESNTEKMIVPVSIMVLGLMVFIGRGAVATIGNGGPSPQSQIQTQTLIEQP